MYSQKGSADELSLRFIPEACGLHWLEKMQVRRPGRLQSCLDSEVWLEASYSRFDLIIS